MARAKLCQTQWQITIRLQALIIEKGWTLYQIVEQYMRSVFRNNGYKEVHTPQLIDKSLWDYCAMPYHTRVVAFHYRCFLANKHLPISSI
jgi:elongation factor P--beta-lysine ligase